MTKLAMSLVLSNLLAVMLGGCVADGAQEPSPPADDPVTAAPFQKSQVAPQIVKLPASRPQREARADWCYDVGDCLECVLTEQNDPSCGGGEWAYVSRWCSDGGFAYEYCR